MCVYTVFSAVVLRFVVSLDALVQVQQGSGDSADAPPPRATMAARDLYARNQVLLQ